MAKPIQSVRGFNDILPERSPAWQHVEGVLKRILHAYGYEEIRLPLLERTELFARSIGAATDIVEKEMYTFEDRNGDSLTLRPEGTAGCVRACIEHGLIHNQQQRLWYTGPMFRHERPQKGRYRQFFQIGAEVFGLEGPDIDAEIILMTARMLKALGLGDVALTLNSLGTAEARQAYRERLVAYLRGQVDALDADSRRRLDTNPLRILDSKSPETQAVLAEAPSLADHLDAASREHFERLCTLLDDAGVAYTVNPRLVRGLDYYGRTVFEWITDRLGAQGTVCAGGRYDGLVEQIGGRSAPAIGFGLGLDRLVALLEEAGELPDAGAVDAYLIIAGDEVVSAAFALAERLREELPGLRLRANCGGGSFKSQFKKADKAGARFALILGEQERDRCEVGVKDLRAEGEQVTLAQDQLMSYLMEAMPRLAGAS